MVVPNSFNAIMKGTGAFSRRWGSTGVDAVDPYVTGYFFTKFSYLPDGILDVIRQKNSNCPYSNMGDIKNALTSSCLSVNIPGGTVNKTDMTGLGGLTYGYPVNVTYDNTISMRFSEWQGAPIYMIISAWVKLMRDYRSGTSTATQKSQFAASMYYWTTAPDGLTVSNAFCFTGMFPLRDPSDQFSHDLAANDKLETDIDFNTDVRWDEKWVYAKCSDFASEYYNLYGGVNASSSPVNIYGQVDAGIA